ncbi:hypothetical protein F5J12DRAFT_890647 [Pisolithus orientalis]|uniref:uncharacterized protein n=1 Tax=Pisolithus orientalis TaxID=936130 RepID=UPI00222410D3|nr:uncharacterized protein F5J12DRAFT_890647 [Pisolithus orientalis]KAI6015312.1 hypothetical protein F5J12DRAFT_890647 [Pisolithus orientalis]
MPYRRISNDLKECALRLWNSGWELEDVCAALGVLPRSCYHWQSIMERDGAVERPPSPLRGRARTTTRAVLNAMEDLLMEDSDLFLDELSTWLAVGHDITISISALGRT